MSERRAKDLLKKLRSGDLSEEERAILESWYLSVAKQSKVDISDEAIERDLNEVARNLPVHREPLEVRYLKPLARISIAAASVALLLFGLLQLGLKPNPNAPKELVTKTSDVSPGSAKAILTLADNSMVELDTASQGEIARGAGITVNKSTDGRLIYTVDADSQLKNEIAAINTISTPKGGEYKIQLADGTVAWLNSMSSLSFPSFFKGEERKVQVSGEVYFEVAKNKKMPFKVETETQTIEVLGTHFNVNTYNKDQAVKTTLIEGSVIVYSSDKRYSKVLKPGEESALFKDGKDGFVVRKVNIEEAVAWKNGYFLFADEDLKSIMEKLSRWYNIEVEYRGFDKSQRYGGMISRTKNLSQVLKIIELSGNAKFETNGRRVIVMP